MKLKDYFDKYQLSVDVFAVGCQVSRASIYRSLKGYKLHEATATLISEATGGEVSIKDLIGEENEKKESTPRSNDHSASC